MICFRSRILFSRTSALQSGIQRDEKEGTSIDDEFTNKTHNIHVTVLNFHCQQQVFNEGGQHTTETNDAYFQFITLS